MTEFRVDVEEILASSEQIKSSVIKMKEFGIALNEIRKGGVFYNASGFVVDESIHRQFEKILDEAARMNSFGNALQLIAEKYSDTEKLLIGNITGESVAFSNQNTSSEPSVERGTDKRKWYQKFWDWITRQEPDDYDTTTLEQEKAADEAMRNQLYGVLQDERYSRAYWEKASIVERKQILQDYMNEVIRIYGLKDVKPSINWESLKYEQLSCTMGQYSHSNHTVTLNENVLSDRYNNWNSYDYLLVTVSHELRHAYQHEAVDHPTRYLVSQETINSWRDNFVPGNYVSPSTDYQRYRDQPVEADARSFQVQRDGTVSD